MKTPALFVAAAAAFAALAVFGSRHAGNPAYPTYDGRVPAMFDDIKQHTDPISITITNEMNL